MLYQSTYWILAAFLVVMALKRPCYSLAGLVCIFGLEQWGQIYIPLLRNISYLSNVIILAPIFLSCMMNFFVRSAWKNILNQNFYLVFCLYAFAAISTLWAKPDVDVISLWLDVLPYMLVSLIALPAAFNNPSDYNRSLYLTLVVGCIVVLLLAYVPRWASRAIYIEGAYASIGLPLALGELSGYVLIIAALKLGKAKLSWLIFVLAAIGALTVTIKSGSRGPLLFSILIVLSFLPLIWKTAFSVKVVGFFVIAVSLIYAIYTLFETSGAYTDRWAYEHMQEDLMSRFDAAFLLIGEMMRSPVSILIGLGNSSSYSYELLGIYPHIVPLEVFAEEGVIGLSLWLLIFFNVIRCMLDYMRNKEFYNKNNRVYPIILGMCLFAFALSFKQGALITNYMPFMFAIILHSYRRILFRSAQYNTKK